MMGMALLDTIPHSERAARHRPWPRAAVGDEGWAAAIDLLAAEKCTLLGLWGDTDAVHMALLGDGAEIAVLSYACKDGRYPSVGAKHPPAIRLERAIQSLFGLTAIGAPDPRPWLDLGFWDVARRRRSPRLMPSCRPKARRCIKSRSGRCTPASSSPGTSASPPMASTSCGWSSGSAMCTRASSN
jgi:hypothetical protein